MNIAVSEYIGAHSVGQLRIAYILLRVNDRFLQYVHQSLQHPVSVAFRWRINDLGFIEHAIVDSSLYFGQSEKVLRWECELVYINQL